MILIAPMHILTAFAFTTNSKQLCIWQTYYPSDNVPTTSIIFLRLKGSEEDGRHFK